MSETASNAEPRPFRPDSPLVDAVVPAVNREPRRGGMTPSILLLHYTGMESCERAIYWLSVPQSRVSCHYVIDVDGRITQMVPESERAWHAGLSFWQGERDINSASIGIEIHNRGHNLGYPEFPATQVASVIALGRGIVARHGITDARVLAHSDVAPARKADPGEKFPWRQLAAAGLGDWVPPAPVDPGDAGLGLGDVDTQVQVARMAFANHGYDTHGPSQTFDAALQQAVTAFQRRFRPARVDGRLDRSTWDTFERLSTRIQKSGS